MGQDEDAHPQVRRANFCRREQARRRRVAHCPKLSQDGFKAEGDVPGYVLEENPLGAAFADNAGDIGPKVPGIIGPAALSGGAERLAGISGEDGIEGAVKGPGIEDAQIIPDWSWSEIACALGGDEDRTRPILPLDKGAGVIAGFGEHDAHIQASAACAEGQAMPGT